MDPLKSFRLDERIVVITGASSGLGRGFARAVSSVGATVVLAARRLERMEELASELRESGTTVFVHQTDVSSPDDCRALARLAAEHAGRIDVLVNNAGVGDSVPASRETPESFRKVIDINLNGTFWMAQACAPAMPRGSSIVNVASVYGLIASRMPQASYSASKAGVLGLTRDLAQQWSQRKGIRVNALAPGYFDSEMTAGGKTALDALAEEHTLLGRFGHQAELDAALLFLASPASGYVTGATLTVDGGMSAV